MSVNSCSVTVAGYAPIPGSYQDGAPPLFQPNAGQVPSYMQPGQQAVVITQQPSVVIVGGCPACRVCICKSVIIVKQSLEADHLISGGRLWVFEKKKIVQQIIEKNSLYSCLKEKKVCS